MTNNQIKNKLNSLADEKYKNFQSKLCPNTKNILGIKVPILRSLAKEISKEDWEDYLKNATDDSYEEIMLQGMVIGLSKMDIEKLKYYLEMFIPKIDNWAVCDITVGGLKITKKYPEKMWEFICKYLKSNKEFELRFAIVMILNYYLTDEYIDKVLEILNNIKHDGYYVKMAVAWTISMSFIKYPDKTLELIKNNNLDEFTHNKSIQKIIESYKVDNKTKDMVRKMKK